MTIKQKTVPKLRFLGFDGPWDLKVLGDVATFLDGQRVPVSEEDRAKRRGDYPYYGASGIIDYIDDYIFDGEFILLGEDGANILTRSTRLAFVIRGKNWVNNHAHVLQAKGSSDFLAECLERIDYKPFNSGTAQPKLNGKICREIPLIIPTLPEQRKIAGFLTAVDGRIGQLSQKKALLEDYKRGVMQQLFTQALRFKDENGNDFPDWEEKMLGAAVTVNPKIPELPESFTYIDLESVTAGALGSPKLIARDGAPSRAQRLLQPGDILYQTVRPYQMNNYFFDLEGVYVASTGYAQLRTTTNDPRFIYHTLHFPSFVRAVMDLCTGTSYPAINSSALASVEVAIPSLPEQTKIADFLSALDRKIESVSSQIRETQAFKKGLLQQMFV
jgi:type I restriction enzyme S subunit